MKKTLFIAAMAGALAMLAQSKKYEGYTLRLEKSLLTGTMDTASLDVAKFDYTGSILKPSKVSFESEQYNYRKGKFEQGSKFTIAGDHLDLEGQYLCADSVFLYFPKKDGSLDWQIYDKSYSKFNANKRAITKDDYVDFSYFIEDFYLGMFNYPKGLFLFSKATMSHNGNTTTSVNTQREGSPESEEITLVKSDSVITIVNKEGQDSLQYIYKYDDMYVPYLYSQMVSTKTVAKTVETITTTYDDAGDVTGKTKYVSFSDLSNLIEVDSSYEYDLDMEHWTLQSVDSIYYESDTVSNMTRSYAFDAFADEIALSAISYTTKGFLFKKGNPIPTAPTDFSVINLLDLLRTSADATPGYKLTWKDKSDNEDGFKIYRKVVGSTNPPSMIYQTGANETEYIDMAVTEVEEYEYFITAFRDEVAPSPAVSTRTDVANAVGDNLILAETAVSPNPVADHVIRVQGISTEVAYSVVNMQGQVVAKGHTSTGVISENIEAGVYVLKLQKNDAVKVLKFEKR
jgi:hypothetical protein